MDHTTTEEIHGILGAIEEEGLWYIDCARTYTVTFRLGGQDHKLSNTILTKQLQTVPRPHLPKCRTQIVPSTASRWTLGAPFFVGRTIIFDIEKDKGVAIVENPPARTPAPLSGGATGSTSPFQLAQQPHGHQGRRSLAGVGAHL